MAKNGPLTTPFDNPLMSTPDPSEATMAGTSGGFTLPDAPTETPNMSELPLLPTTVGGLKDAPAPGTSVEIAGGVTAPGIPIMSGIDKK